MTKENIIKLHKHFSNLAEGKFNERDFDKNYGKGGSAQMGEMPPERKELIKSDAKRHKEDLEKKHSLLIEGEKSENNVLEKVKENKSKKQKK